MTNINFKICFYIYSNWVKTYKSQRAFALDHNLEESIVRKIKNTAINKDETEYNIPVKTLNKICEARNITLSEFFKTIET